MSSRAAERMALVALSVGAVAIALAAAPFPTFDLDRHAVPKELALHVTALFAGVPLLWRRQPSLTRLDRWLGAWLVLSLLSFLGATNHWLGFRAFALSVSGLTCCWSARQVAVAGYRRPLLRAIAFAAVLGALTGLLQAYGVDFALAALSRAPGGTFGNRNFLAHAVALALPVVIWVALEAPGRRAAALALAGLLFMTALLVLSRSRAAWLGAGAGIGTLLVGALMGASPPLGGPQRGRLVVGAVALVIGAVAALGLPNALSWKSDSPYAESLKSLANYREGSGHGRLIQYRNTLGMVRDDPILGVGPGNWAVAYPRYTTPGDPAFVPGAVIPTNPWPSSDWVALLAERGVLAFVAFGGVALQLAWAAWSAARSGPVDARMSAWCGAAVLASLLVVGSFDAVLLLGPANLLTMAALGALIPVSSPSARPMTGGWLLGIRLLLPLIVVAAIIRSAMQTLAMAEWTSARSVAMQESAAHWDPANFRIRMSLAVANLAHGRRTEGCGHARAAVALQPNNAPAVRLARRCGER